MESNIFYEVLVTHGGVALFRPDAPDCAGEWRENDTARGHIARDGHIDIAVPDHDGLCAIAFSPQVPDGATGPVPLAVQQDGLVIATLADEHALMVPAGHYHLFYIIKGGNDARYGQALVLSLQPA
jgi:hypothetical protein